MNSEINNRLHLWILITQLDTNHCILPTHFLMIRIQSKKCIIAIYALIYDTYVAFLFQVYFLLIIN
jgi:hypothetical protein